MKYSSLLFAQLIPQICKQHGVFHIVISPGSRNAPLIVGFSEDKSYKLYSIVDERCAAFFALGLSQQILRPVVLVCTSGSAIANYYPAICEAFYSDVPLIVISTDRPSHKIDIGDGQTIRQQNFFSNHITHEVQLKEESEKAIHEIDKAIKAALSHQGPVHINVPFEEPLYKTTSTPTYHPIIEGFQKENKNIPTSDLAEFMRKWEASSKRMILIGQLAPNSLETKILEKITQNRATLVLCETTSNINISGFIINDIDNIVIPIENSEVLKEKFQPEILLTIGEMVISKKIKNLLRIYPPKYHFHVGEKKAYNTYYCLSHHFKTRPYQLLESIANAPSSSSDYQKFWEDFRKDIHQKHVDFASKSPFSDFFVFDFIFQNIPSSIQIHLSNSSTVRYAQLFASHISQEVFCNRGTSGIEGCTSTAIGSAVGSGRKTLLVTGDLSFFYDANGLWNAYLPKDFKIILINNNGGGIFRILQDEPDKQDFQDFLETTHKMNAAPLAKLHRLNYHFAQNLEELKLAWGDFWRQDERPQILEIRTPRTLNDLVLKDYFQSLKQ